MPSNPMQRTSSALLVLLAATASAAFSPASRPNGRGALEVSQSANIKPNQSRQQLQPRPYHATTTVTSPYSSRLFASPSSSDDGSTDDVSVPYNAAALLSYRQWRAMHRPPKVKASQRVLSRWSPAGRTAAAAAAAYDARPIDAAKFAVFERNYNAVTIANVRARKAAREYGGVAEIAELGPDADTVEIGAVDVDGPVDIDDDDEEEEVVGDDVSIPYDAAARVAYGNWCMSNGRTVDETKFAAFEKNYVAVAVANVMAKKAARESEGGDDASVKLLDLGSDADGKVVQTSSVAAAGSTTGGGGSDILKKVGTLSFGEQFSETFKWKPSTDGRLRSALGIDASSASEDSAFFFTEGEEEGGQKPHPPNVRPSDKVIRDNAEEKNVVVTPQDEQKAVAMKTRKALQRDYNVTISYDKIQEILTPIFTGKIEPNVSTDAIKGAALAGAALPIIAGAKGAGLSLAALSALWSSYLAVTQGYGGDAARVIGELAWKSTGALKTVASTSKVLIAGATDVVKDMNHERLLDAVAKGDAEAATKMDKEVQRVLIQAEEAVAEAEKAAGKAKAEADENLDEIAALEEEARQAEEAARIAEEEAAKAAELARLEDEELLAKEFEKARMEEMRAEAVARAHQERMEEDQRRAEEEAARLAEEDRLAAEAEAAAALAADEAVLEEKANQLLAAAEEERLAAEEARLEEAALLAEEAEALIAANGASEESEKLRSLQDAAQDADIAAQARAAVEAMEAQAAAEAYPDFDEDDETFLSDEDLEASIAMAQELDGDIAGVDGLLSALKELDADGELDQTPEFDEDDETFLEEEGSSPPEPVETSQEDLARAAREAVSMYEAEMAAKSQDRAQQKAEWAAEALPAVEELQEDTAVATELKPPTTASSGTDWSKLTVVKLKDELRGRGLKVSGKKAVLIQRLEEDDMSR